MRTPLFFRFNHSDGVARWLAVAACVLLACAGRASAALTGTLTINATWDKGYTATLVVSNSGSGGQRLDRRADHTRPADGFLGRHIHGDGESVRAEAGLV